MDSKHTPIASARIAVIGLGYVGLPLAVAFARLHPVLGFDTDATRIRELRLGIDPTREVEPETLLGVTAPTASATGLTLSDHPADLRDCTVYIITVPTPIDAFKAPDLRPLTQASVLVGSMLKPGDLVIYESTVYPGCTEEVCVPLLEEASGLQFNRDFAVGYSPERVSPGDKMRRLPDIVKVTSGSTPVAAEHVDALYRQIITAGTHRAPSIQVAEAAKAVENAQRDVNISFVNELALIFDRLGIDTQDVLEAAGTKWNFLPFKPGLVGGHCIGVDPYYLAHKAEQAGYLPAVILSGRRVNEQMGAFVAGKVVKLLLQRDIALKGARALILGITFKENCPDVRNSRVVDIYQELEQFGLDVHVYDPWADARAVKAAYGIALRCTLDDAAPYHAIVVAVGHRDFLALDYPRIKAPNGILFDIKGVLNREYTDARL
ncbi:UDP-N-acetyl-D-galactosamine dehydrogenase [Parapedobacter composti]|uniref:UDP-N-acetyl-D-galactosamine dehydrogenase n=1 Tax=Parapedobacter composti TaxID=623281 RepID=A0A1I1IUC5_9SPHI|nr:nucleotide sugar dehydrogenase [Parapedobacter composti]SFC37333.1 UDP-N-acetyl-D-galactosamine dehydrogenase [Parapedobacter composti]